MTAPAKSDTLSKDLQAMPSFLQEVLDAKVKGDSLSYAAETMNFISSWVFPSYNRLLNARQDRTLHVFPDKTCLFDYTKEKAGGIAGNYPTIHGHKVAFYPHSTSRFEVVQNTFETDYFEIVKDGLFKIVEYYKEDGQPLSSRTWTVHNPLQFIQVDGVGQNCYWGKLVIPSP